MELRNNNHHPKIDEVLFLARIYAYEFLNYFSAVSILQTIEKLKMSKFQQFELYFLKNDLKQKIRYTYNHKVVKKNFLNVDKFFKIHKRFD